METFSPANKHATSLTEWKSNPHYNSLYVWCHINADGKPFYIGRGRASYAWDKTFGLVWEKYVSDYLGGEYYIVIEKYNLDDYESEYLIDSGLKNYSSTILNTNNIYRCVDLMAIDRRKFLKAELKPLYGNFNNIKKNGTNEELVILCKTALALQYKLSVLQVETGLYGEILNLFPTADINLFFIVPYISGLLKLNQFNEAKAELDLFLETKSAANYLSSSRILALQKRINKKNISP